MPQLQVPFVGPSYRLNSREADGQRVVNMYPTRNEVQGGKTGVYLESIPGLDLFSDGTPTPPPAGGPWLYYPTQDWPGQSEDSVAPIHKRTYEYAPITVAPEPFVDGVGAVDNTGNDNTQSVSEVYIALHGDSGLPAEGQYTWEPANPESSVAPTFTTFDPSGGAWLGGAVEPNLFVGLSAGGGAVIGWAGGVLTLYAGNNPETSTQQTVITFLPSGFVYPPVAVEYVQS